MKSKILTGKSKKVESLPDDWHEVKLNKVAEIKGGFAFDSTKFQEDGIYQVVKMSNLYEGNLDLSRSKSFIDKLTPQQEEYLLNNGDILITLTGTIGKRDYGYSYQINGEQNLLLNQRVAKLTIQEANSKYIYYEIKTNRFLNQFFYSARGGTGNQANVGTQDLGSIKIALPPLSEQKSIAHILSSMDEVINKHDQLIIQKEQRKKWLIQQLLTGKKRLKGFSGDWNKYSYTELLKIVKRPVKWSDNELYHLISVRRRSGGIFERESLYGSQIKVKDLRTAKSGDFLFSKMQIVHGASALVREEFDGAKISGSYIAVVAKDKATLDINFFEWHSKTPYFYHQTYISSFGVHIEKMTFDFESFLQLEMKLPTIAEQVAINNVLEAADLEIKLLKSRAEKMKEKKKWLMQVLLTGKKRLKI